MTSTPATILVIKRAVTATTRRGRTTSSFPTVADRSSTTT
ncbi:UNVERIFIED_CONTAM: hypothetical protein GTU68_044887 [Idotea baltica]|nr:hypothetical protein [Idotea baltica]